MKPLIKNKFLVFLKRSLLEIIQSYNINNEQK